MPDKQWHPLFVTAVREALSDARHGQVDIQAEVALSSRPLDIDVLVVKKEPDTQLSHPMAQIFRRYNVFEYKSPKDYLAPNDYYKGMALTLLYKALEYEELLTLDDFTLTLISSRYPRELLKMIRNRKEFRVEKNSPVPGIYQIYGERLPVQVVVLNGLTKPEEAYMFSPFLTGSGLGRLGATTLLLRIRLNNPDNPYVEELVDFKLRNEIMNQEEMEVFAQMVAQMSTAERARVRQILRNSVVGREMIEEAKVQDKQDVVQKLLIRRFSAESSEVQKEVQQLNDLEVLDGVLMDLFASNSLEEAKDVIAKGVRIIADKDQALIPNN